MSFKPTSPGNRQTQVTKSPRYFSKPGSTASKRPNNLQINSQEDEEIPTKSHNSATNVKSRDNFTSLFRYGKNSPTAASAKQGFRYSPKGSTQVAKQASSPTVQSRTPSYQTRSKPATPKKASTPKAASSRFEETKYKKSATPKSRDRPSPSNYVFPTTKQNPMTKSSSRLQRREAQTTAGAQQKPAAQRQDHLNQFITKVKGTESSAQQKTQSPEEIKMRSEVIYREHLFQTFQALKFIRQLPQVDQAQLRSKRVNLSRMNEKIGKKTLVFDLDETLVHCCDDITTSNPHVILPIIFPTGEEVNAGINIRPYAKEWLMEANKYFEVIVFTASHECYANVVLDHLDPTRELIQHRLFRDNCVQVDGIFIKDLRVLQNRKLTDTVIVDNAAYSFGYQIDNGIPIISWHDDPYDRELFNLMDYMKGLAVADDVREINRKTFRLKTFYHDYINEFLSGETQQNTAKRR